MLADSQERLPPPAAQKAYIGRPPSRYTRDQRTTARARRCVFVCEGLQPIRKSRGGTRVSPLLRAPSIRREDTMADPSDWEDWDPSQGNFLHHMVAGSVAGITEHTVMYPVDTFKTYVQCMRECPEAVAGRRVMEMVRGQGMLRLWRGVGTMFTGCVPAHALYFSVLEHCKVSVLVSLLSCFWAKILLVPSTNSAKSTFWYVEFWSRNVVFKICSQS